MPVEESRADQHDARSVPEVAAPAPPSLQMSWLDIMMCFTQAVERIEMLLTSQATRGQAIPPGVVPLVPPPQPEMIAAPAPTVAPVSVQSEAESRLARFLKLTPPKFEGNMGDDLYNFTFTVERCFEVMELMDEAMRIRFASFLLDGRAARWWQDVASLRISTWAEFKNELMLFVLL